MRPVIWFFFWPAFVSCVFAYMFYVRRDEAVELPMKVPYRTYSQIRQNQPEHAPGWFGSKSEWLLLFLVFMVIPKFPGGSDRSNMCTPHGHLHFHLALQEERGQRLNAYEDLMGDALIQPENNVENLVYGVINLSLTEAAGGNRQYLNIDVLYNTQNSIYVYGAWYAKDPDGVEEWE